MEHEGAGSSPPATVGSSAADTSPASGGDSVLAHLLNSPTGRRSVKKKLEHSEMGRAPAFVINLWNMLQDRQCTQYIHWSDDGLSVVMEDQTTIAALVLPMYFNSSSIASFLRQLNFYNFKRLPPMEKSAKGHEIARYQHKFFQRGKPQLLGKVIRKTNHRVINHIVEERKKYVNAATAAGVPTTSLVEALPSPSKDVLSVFVESEEQRNEVPLPERGIPLTAELLLNAGFRVVGTMRTTIDLPEMIGSPSSSAHGSSFMSAMEMAGIGNQAPGGSLELLTHFGGVGHKRGAYALAGGHVDSLHDAGRGGAGGGMYDTYHDSGYGGMDTGSEYEGGYAGAPGSGAGRLTRSSARKRARHREAADTSQPWHPPSTHRSMGAGAVPWDESQQRPAVSVSDYENYERHMAAARYYLGAGATQAQAPPHSDSTDSSANSNSPAIHEAAMQLCMASRGNVNNRFNGTDVPATSGMGSSSGSSSGRPPAAGGAGGPWHRAFPLSNPLGDTAAVAQAAHLLQDPSAGSGTAGGAVMPNVDPGVAMELLTALGSCKNESGAVSPTRVAVALQQHPHLSAIMQVLLQSVLATSKPAADAGASGSAAYGSAPPSGGARSGTPAAPQSFHPQAASGGGYSGGDKPSSQATSVPSSSAYPGGMLGELTAERAMLATLTPAAFASSSRGLAASALLPSGPYSVSRTSTLGRSSSSGSSQGGFASTLRMDEGDKHAGSMPAASTGGGGGSSGGSTTTGGRLDTAQQAQRTGAASSAPGNVPAAVQAATASSRPAPAATAQGHNAGATAMSAASMLPPSLSTGPLLMGTPSTFPNLFSPSGGSLTPAIRASMQGAGGNLTATAASSRMLASNTPWNSSTFLNSFFHEHGGSKAHTEVATGGGGGGGGGGGTSGATPAASSALPSGAPPSAAALGVTLHDFLTSPMHNMSPRFGLDMMPLASMTHAGQLLTDLLGAMSPAAANTAGSGSRAAASGGVGAASGMGVNFASPRAASTPSGGATSASGKRGGGYAASPRVTPGVVMASPMAGSGSPRAGGMSTRSSAAAAAAQASRRNIRDLGASALAMLPAPQPPANGGSEAPSGSESSPQSSPQSSLSGLESSATQLLARGLSEPQSSDGAGVHANGAGRGDAASGTPSSTASSGQELTSARNDGGSSVVGDDTTQPLSSGSVMASASRKTLRERRGLRDSLLLGSEQPSVPAASMENVDAANAILPAAVDVTRAGDSRSGPASVLAARGNEQNGAGGGGGGGGGGNGIAAGDDDAAAFNIADFTAHLTPLAQSGDGIALLLETAAATPPNMRKSPRHVALSSGVAKASPRHLTPAAATVSPRHPSSVRT